MEWGWQGLLGLAKDGKIGQMNTYQEGLDQLSKYSADADKIIDGLINKVNNQSLDPEIAHYTNDLGLAGILGSGVLRFTDVFDLNDPSEIEHGFSHAVNLLNGLSINGSRLEKQFAQSVHDLYKHKLKGTANYYVCSFSTECDDLGQWRSYADNGKGYALIFDTKALEDHFTKTTPNAKDHNSTFNVRYNDNEIGLIQGQLINGMFNLISFAEKNSLTKGEFNSYMQLLSTQTTARIIHAALFYKHEAYKNEKEYRFMQIFRGDIPTPNVKTRTRNYQSVEYMEFNWLPSNALKKIVIGPSANIANAQNFATKQLNAVGLGRVQIEQSKIPYRVF